MRVTGSNVVNCCLDPESVGQSSWVQDTFQALRGWRVWKYRITEKLSQGPMLLWKQWENHKHHRVTSSSNVLPLSSLNVWITARYCTGPGSHPARHAIVIPLTVTLFLFLQVPGKLMEQVNVGLFSVATSIWWTQSTWEASNKGGNWL